MPLKALRLGQALSTPVPEIDFVLHGLPVGAVGALVAPGSSGKTFFAAQIAAALALGLPIAGGALPAPEKCGKTVLLAGEESAVMLVRRFHALVTWLLSMNDYLPLEEHIHRGHIISSLDAAVRVYPLAGHPLYLIAAGKQTEHVAHLAKACDGARLLIVDPLRRFHDGDENSSADMTAVVQTIESLTTRVGCAALVTHHTNKAATLSGTGDLQQAARGSSALTDAVRFQANLVGMGPDEAARFGVAPDERRFYVRLELSKANYIPPTPGAWMRRMPGGCLQRVVLREQRAPRAAGRRKWDE